MPPYPIRPYRAVAELPVTIRSLNLSAHLPNRHYSGSSSFEILHIRGGYIAGLVIKMSRDQTIDVNFLCENPYDGR